MIRRLLQLLLVPILLVPVFITNTQAIDAEANVQNSCQLPEPEIPTLSSETMQAVADTHLAYGSDRTISQMSEPFLALEGFERFEADLLIESLSLVESIGDFSVEGEGKILLLCMSTIEGGKVPRKLPIDVFTLRTIESEPHPSSDSVMNAIDISLYVNQEMLGHKFSTEEGYDNSHFLDMNQGKATHFVLAYEVSAPLDTLILLDGGGNASVMLGSTDQDLSVITDKTSQPSGVGGIGNTRSNLYNYWSFDENTTPMGELIEDGFHYVTYDYPAYQVSFMFMLEADEVPRPTDRVVDIIVSYIKFMERDVMDRLVAGWLPDDARVSGRAEVHMMGDLIQPYHSDAIAEVVTFIDYPGFSEPGGIWVAYWPTDGNVGVVEISLFHPRP